MRVLVSGGAGFLGSHLVDRLLAEGNGVDVVDDLSTGSLGHLAAARAEAARSGAELKFHHLDIRSPDLAELVGRRRTDVIVHLAVRAPSRIGDGPAAEHLVGSTLGVLEAARRCGTGKVVAALDAHELYGDVATRDLPVRESQPWAPTTAFGVAQRAVADLLGVYRARHAIEFTALALSAVYGPRQAPDRGPVAAFVDAARAGRPCRIEGDGRQTLDLLFVDDAVDALVRAALRGTGLVVNVGTGVQTTVRELERLVAGEGAPPPEHLPAPGHTGRFAVAPTRARIHLGWAPWTSLPDGVAATRAAGAA